MRTAAQLYTVRKQMQTTQEIEEGFNKLKKMGYNAVQVSGIGPIEPERLKDLADEVGLEICATHNSYTDFTEDIDPLIAKHQLWECKYVGLGGMPGEYRDNADGYKKFAREASVFGKTLKDAGLQFIYHNHNFEFIRFGNLTGMDIMLQESDPDTFHFEIDTYWVQAGGGDPAEWIEKVAGRMAVVHFKDMAVDGREQIFAEIGEGNLNWDRILKACYDTGVEWCPVEQDVCQRDPFESLEISLKNLKEMGVEA